jgi:hypothetical protein
MRGVTTLPQILHNVQVAIGLFNCFAFSDMRAVDGCSAVFSMGAGGNGSSICSTCAKNE